MKYRESNMPTSDLWGTFFNPKDILNQLGVDNKIDTFLDIGSGYGTFLFPAVDIVRNKVIGIDIDPEMINLCKDYVSKNNLSNVELILGDIDTIQIEYLKSIADIDYIALFNMLHCEKPTKILKYAYDILEPNGRVGVIHWKYEKTPRGPSMEIRPKPENIIEWAEGVGLTAINQIDLPPYHYGIKFIK